MWEDTKGSSPEASQELECFGVVNVEQLEHSWCARASARQSCAPKFCAVPFQPELMICPAGEVLLARGEWLREHPGKARPVRERDAKAPRKLPPLPVGQPPGSGWEVQWLS
jgi:hypothetical protein